MRWYLSVVEGSIYMSKSIHIDNKYIKNRDRR